MAKIKAQNAEETYRVYVTECLRTMVENTAKFGGGAVIKKHYFDFVQKENKKEEKKDSDSIISEVIAKGGLKIKK